MGLNNPLECGLMALIDMYTLVASAVPYAVARAIVESTTTPALSFGAHVEEVVSSRQRREGRPHLLASK